MADNAQAAHIGIMIGVVFAILVLGGVFWKLVVARYLLPRPYKETDEERLEREETERTCNHPMHQQYFLEQYDAIQRQTANLALLIARQHQTPIAPMTGTVGLDAGKRDSVGSVGAPPTYKSTSSSSTSLGVKRDTAIRRGNRNDPIVSPWLAITDDNTSSSPVNTPITSTSHSGIAASAHESAHEELRHEPLFAQTRTDDEKAGSIMHPGNVKLKDWETRPILPALPVHPPLVLESVPSETSHKTLDDAREDSPNPEAESTKGGNLTLCRTG
ncbi:hypothetical protein DL93DRAFT_2073158 [Clavulina sp. PMI_390]|nr:hypothetical protein DL93DRAFT_2073158 [Clavulina sp. PMI_390]